LDGRIQFRLKPEKLPELYVIYNESDNGDDISDEIVRKVILPNARSFCRLEGSSKLGKDFIDGTTRMEFERRFANAMKMACEPLGIEVQEVLITSTRPPEKIAKPIQQREEARLEEKKYQEQIKQQESERDVAEERALALQKAALVEVDQKLTRVVTSAMQEQEVAVTKADERLAVAKLRLEASKDEAEAIVSRGKAEADVIGFENEADAAGWKQAVKAYDGNGLAYAQYVLYQKLSSAYRRIMINTQDSPLMKVFEGVNQPNDGPRPPSVPSLAKDVSETNAPK
jgi:regulator of protease activity HflC (stomatin/prohibitin superfamily)